jgi:hypothetical protein
MHPTPKIALATVAAAALLAACGGGSVEDTPPPPVQPLYELAQALPPEPDDIDADGSAASARRAPGRATLLGTGAPAEAGAEGLRQHILAAHGPEGTATAAAAAPAATYYTAAQVRAAYGLDKLPANSSSNKGAYQGSGQTIAIVGAFHNANIALDLAAFSAKFGLPSCAVQSIAATATLPLARPAQGSSCTFSVVHATAAGGMSARAPAANSNWATETSMDVEWAHAIAPMARIILVQAASGGGNDIVGAITLAGRLGATVVSMSFGGAEFSGQAAYEKAFLASGVSYLAATGDNGRAVAWPAVSPSVLAVGGTTLAANGSTRSETAWAGSGGGISQFNTVPSWQVALKVTPSTGKAAAPTRRVLPDVAFNANPSSGQLIYVTPSSGSNGWLVAGGTSVGTPQWAGLIAVANAVRVLNGKPVLGPLGAPLYRSLSGSAANYAASLLDVTAGSNGGCVGCAATAGYDLVTGLGTPHAVKTVELLAAY